jgi:hypothetical protein
VDDVAFGDVATVEKAVAVSFAGFHSDPYARYSQTGRYANDPPEDPSGWGPTLRALADTRSELYGRVSDWYYLCHPEGTPREVASLSIDVARATGDAIEHHLPADKRPEFHPVVLQTSGPPTDHADLFAATKIELQKIRGAHPKAELVLVLSAGTPQMHAVLLLAGSVKVVEGRIRIVQIALREGARRRPDRPVTDVTLKLDTILQVAGATTAVVPGVDDAPVSAYDKATSAPLRRALDRVREAAVVPFPILLRGERGVGKSTLAKFVRAASPYRVPDRDGTWPAVACGQFSNPERLQAELCGTVKGAFTGAENKEGLLALADKDTLFLDEIHDMSAACQRVMIRVLEDRTYYRMGSNKPSKSAFRLITGTNQPNDVLDDRLGPDFLDRIRDIEIEIPPLRECRGDLPWMWIEAWSDAAGRARLDARELEAHHTAIIAELQEQPLPGNWRDLRRLAVHLAIFLHAGKQASKRSVERAVQEFLKDERSREASRSVAVPSGRRRRQNPKYDADLERDLGAGFERFWPRVEAGDEPGEVLKALLGGARARHALAHIERRFPERLQAVRSESQRRRR